PQRRARHRWLRHASRAIAIGASVFIAALLAACSRDDTPWPNRPIKIEVAYLTGNAADSLPHVVAHHLARVLRSPVFVMPNRQGSHGVAAAVNVAHAPADGYTLLIASTDAMLIAPVLDSSAAAVSDLCAVALVAETPHVLVVGRDSQIDTL